MASSLPETADSVTDPEAWDHLSRHRRRKESFLSSAVAVQSTCPKDPGHLGSPVSDCKLCHRKILDLISRRYLSSPGTEWYADRRTFLQHLAELFPAVKRGEVDASGIEDRVMDEKRRWFRESVRRVAVAMGGSGMVEGKEELVRLMDDQRLKFADFCERVKEVIARGLKTGVPDGSLEKLMATGNDPKARADAYREILFFPDGERGEIGESTRKYLDMVQQGVSISKVTARMVEDRKQGIADRAELERLQNRIEYLKKAKATWLAQRKRGEPTEEKPKVQPPCFRCGNQQEVVDPPSCAVCQVAVAHGVLEEAVVYCSEECQRLGHEQHVAEAHKCAGKHRCTTLHQPEEDDKNSGPSNDTGDVYLCKECLEKRKTVAVFCSLACADANSNRHREEFHPSYEAGRVYDYYGSATHLVTLEQALRDMQEKQVIDELTLVPKLPPPVESRKPQAGDTSDARMDIDKGDDLPSKAEASSSDRMDMDGANERALDGAPASPTRAPSLRHDDERPAADKTSGVEPQPTREPAQDRTADTEMMDAVEATDFAGQPDPPKSDPSPAPEQPAESHRGSDHQTPAQQPASSPPPTVPSPAAKPEPAPNSPPPPVNPPTCPEPPPESSHPPHSIPPASSPTVDPAEDVPLVSARAAAAVSQPRVIIIKSPDRITSIEPMPSLGRSLEIEIAKIPAGSGSSSEEVKQREDDDDAAAAAEEEAEAEAEANAKTETELARERDRLEDMDRIADGRMERIAETAAGMGLVSGGDVKDRELSEEQEGSLMTGGHTTGPESEARRAAEAEAAGNNEIRPDEAAMGGGGDRGSAGGAEPAQPPLAADHDKPPTPDQDPEVLQPPGSHKTAQDDAAHAANLAQRAGEKITPTTITNTSNPAAQSAGKEAGKLPSTEPSSTDEPSQKSSSDSKEEGEISDDSSGKKRKKADSVEPGEVEEDGREVKKARSVDAPDGERRTARD